MLYSRISRACTGCWGCKTGETWVQPWHKWTISLLEVVIWAWVANPWSPVRVWISSCPWVRFSGVMLSGARWGCSCCCCCFCSFLSSSGDSNVCKFLLSKGFWDLLVPFGSSKVGVQVIVVRIGVRVEVVIAVVAMVVIVTSHTSRVVAGVEGVVRAVSAVVSKWAIVRVVGVMIACKGVYI